MTMTRSDEGRALLDEVGLRLREIQRDPSAVPDSVYIELRRDARRAIDRLDDEPEFERAHGMLDDVGKLTRQERPHLCRLEKSVSDDGDFVDSCPVSLGHVRLGFSAGFEIEESHCSICEIDPWHCPHVPGDVYDGQMAMRVITKATMFEVSVVRRPDFADARIAEQTITRAEVEALLGGPLPEGAKPVCDNCLSSCPGVRGSAAA